MHYRPIHETLIDSNPSNLPQSNQRRSSRIINSIHHNLSSRERESKFKNSEFKSTNDSQSKAHLQHHHFSSTQLRNPSFFTELIMIHSDQFSIIKNKPSHYQSKTHQLTPTSIKPHPISSNLNSINSKPTSHSPTWFTSPTHLSSDRSTFNLHQTSSIPSPTPSHLNPHPPQSLRSNYLNSQSNLVRNQSRSTFDLISSTLINGLDLDSALRFNVINSIGQEIQFGELLHPKFRTVVIFIRHFRCPYCQTYLKQLSDLTSKRPELTNPNSRIKFVIIGQGHFEMIGAYRELYNCPFPIYSESTSRHPLYQALGMTDKSLRRGLDSEKGDYLNQVSSLEIILRTFKNAASMPLKYGGDLKQLGGEFVFEPVVQHRIRRKPVQLNSSHPSSQPTTMTNINPNKLSRRPTGSLFQSQLLINLSNRVNGLDSPTTTSFGSTASTSTHLTHSTTSTTQSSISTALTSMYSDSERSEVLYQCRFVHRMKNMRDHASLNDVLIAAGLRIS